MFVNRGNATAYLSHSSRLLSKIAELLGRDREAEHDRSIAAATRAAWQRACALTDGPAPFGTVGASWRITDSTVTYTVELPLGTTGAVISPDGTTHEVASGAHTIQWTNP